MRLSPCYEAQPLLLGSVLTVSLSPCYKDQSLPFETVFDVSLYLYEAQSLVYMRLSHCFEDISLL